MFFEVIVTGSRCRVGLKTRPSNFFFVFLGDTPVPPPEKKLLLRDGGVGYSSNFSRDQ